MKPENKYPTPETDRRTAQFHDCFESLLAERQTIAAVAGDCVFCGASLQLGTRRGGDSMKPENKYPTPETDRRTAQFDGCCCIASDFAQCLERRLACAIEALESVVGSRNLEEYERNVVISVLAQIREGKPWKK